MRGYSLEKMKHVGLVLILSVLIGLSVGALDAGFGRVLDYISIFFHQHKHILLPFLGFCWDAVCSYSTKIWER